MINMKCIVIANQIQLEEIGISQNLTGKEVEYIKDFPTGYSLIKTEPSDNILKVLGDKAEMELYDIPKKWLKFI